MTEARQKAEERLAKAWKDQCIANELNIFEDDVVIAHIEWLRAALVAREQELEKYRSTVAWIASQQNLFFAECSQAEEIIARCKECLGALPEAPKEGQ